MKKLFKALMALAYTTAVIAILAIVPYIKWSVIITYCLSFLILYLPVITYILVSNKGKYYQKKIRGILFSMKIHNRPHGLLIDKGVRIYNKQCVKFGNNVSIDNGAEIHPLVNYNGQSYPSEVIIGNNVVIGSYDRFASMTSVIIEDDVLFAAFVHITDHSHEFRDVSLPVYAQGVYQKGPVRIGKGSWLGFRCNILSGVTIGEHCIIAAGAVVTKDVPPYSIAAGVPARVIKKYDFERKEWTHV